MGGLCALLILAAGKLWHCTSAYSFKLALLCPLSEGRHSEAQQPVGLGGGWGRHCRIRCCCLPGCFSSFGISRTVLWGYFSLC